MRVLILTSTVSPKISIGNIATELDRFLTSSGHETAVLFLDCLENPRPEKYIRVKGTLLYKVYSYASSRSRYLFHCSPVTISRVHREILRFKPDIVQIIQPYVRYVDNQGLFRMLGKTGIPCVYTMIDESAYLGDCDNAYDCLTFQKGCQLCSGENYDKVHSDMYDLWTLQGCRRLSRTKERGYAAVSNICFVAPKWVVERAESSYLLHGRRFYAVDEYVNTHDVYIPSVASAEKWKAIGMDPEKIIILNVNRFSNVRKGVRFFVELARMLEEDERYQFVNVGFDRDAAAEHLPRNYIPVSFVGDQKELAQYLSVADLLITTSLSDTMPNICLEALSCGTPVCGFRITGIPYVAEEPLGRFVEPGNVEQLKEVVLATGKKTAVMARACREYALKRYSPEVSGQKMVEIYQEMIRLKDGSRA